MNTGLFRELKLGFGKAPYTSQGILSLPVSVKPVPVILIVPGSGGVDKDLSIGPNKIYKDLAWSIAAKGVATFRYDKRTFLYMQEMLNDNQSGQKPFDVRSEYLEDIESIISLLVKRKEIDPSQIYILGHSEGGYLVPLFNKHYKNAAGFISLSGTLREMPLLAMEQFDYLLDSTNAQQNAQRISAKTQCQNSLAANVKTTMQDKDVMAPWPVNYWLYLKKYNAAQLAAPIKKPLLVIQGERDYQVKMIDFNSWKKVLADKSNVTFQSYPKLNHLYLEGEGDGLSKPSEYFIPSNVPEYVADDIVKWVKKVNAKK